MYNTICGKDCSSLFMKASYMFHISRYTTITNNMITSKAGGC